MVQIFAQIPGKPTTAVELEGKSTIEDVMMQILSVLEIETWPNKFPVYCQGRHVPEGLPLSLLSIPNGATLNFQVPLRGGGGDGGATGAESRDCYLEMYLDRKPDKVDPNEARIAKWTRCKVSSEVLMPPCVIDFLGNIFNKCALLEHIVTNSMPKGLGHIRGMKDIIDVKLAENPVWVGGEKKETNRFYCPISGLEFSGLFKFYALKSCGHVLSAKALKELKGSSCLVCYTEFTEDDKLVINGTEEEVEALREKMDERKKNKQKYGRKEKRVHGVAIAGGMAVPEEHVERVKVQDEGKSEKRKSVPSEVRVQETKVEVQRPKGSDLVEQLKRYKAGAHVPAGATPEVYSSIFSSSRKEKLKETYSCRSLPLGRN